MLYKKEDAQQKRDDPQKTEMLYKKRPIRGKY